jgi:hypothetical protein
VKFQQVEHEEMRQKGSRNVENLVPRMQHNFIYLQAFIEETLILLNLSSRAIINSVNSLLMATSNIRDCLFQFQFDPHSPNNDGSDADSE